jgi:hypothetical protein
MLDARTGLVPNLQRPYTTATELLHDQVRAVGPALGDAALLIPGDPAQPPFKHRVSRLVTACIRVQHNPEPRGE